MVLNSIVCSALLLCRFAFSSNVKLTRMVPPGSPQAMLICLTFNLICASTMLGYSTQDNIASFFLAFIYFIAGMPLAFLLWYKQLYDATVSDNTRHFCMFFVMFFVHIGFCVFAAIGECCRR